MRKNNLTQLLESFDNKELKRFQQFISSPYFNVDKRLIHLFKLLKELVLHKAPFNDSIQTKIYQQLFSDIDPITHNINSEQKKLLGVRISLLGKLAKRFLMVEVIEDPKCEINLLDKKLLDKKQYNLLEQFYKNHLQLLANNKTKDLDHITQTVQLEIGRMEYLYTRDLFQKEDNLSDLMQNLDLYYLIWKLRLHIMMKSMLLNKPERQYDFEPLKAINSLLKLPKYATNSLLILYLTTIELIETNQESTYQRLIQLLDQYSDQVSTTDLAGFYTVATNFCSQKSRKKDQIKFIEESFRLYKVIEQKKLLVDGKVLQIIKLSNLVDLSCKVGDFRWATELVNKYYSFIEQEKQESTKHLLLGVIHFYQKHYEEVLGHLKQVEEIGLPYDIISRTLRVKSSYELDKNYSFYTMQVFISAQAFIRNKKEIPKERKKSYQNFIQLLINLYKIRHKEGRMTLVKVKDKMGKMDLISHEKWLLEKIEELTSLGRV